MRRGGFQRAVRGGGPRLEPEEGLRLAAGALVEKAARLLGLGARARAVAVGRQAVAEALARGRARVILVAQDAGRDAAAWAAAARGAAGVPLLVFPSKGRLGRALGRGEAAVAGVCDPALAAGIIGYLHAAGRMAEGASSTEANLGPPAAADGPADGRGGG
jgi:ribosomal protein L7Ae-like RNA K-turn-binding protein